MKTFENYFNPEVLNEVAMSGFAAYQMPEIKAFVLKSKTVKLVPDRGVPVTISWEKVDLGKFADKLAEKLQVFSKTSASAQKMDNASANKYFSDIPGIVTSVG